MLQDVPLRQAYSQVRITGGGGIPIFSYRFCTNLVSGPGGQTTHSHTKCNATDALSTFLLLKQLHQRRKASTHSVTMDWVRTTSRFLVTPISLLVGVWLGVLLSFLAVNICCELAIGACLVGVCCDWLSGVCVALRFRTSHKYREQIVLVGWNTIILSLEIVIWNCRYCWIFG